MNSSLSVLLRVLSMFLLLKMRSFPWSLWFLTMLIWLLLMVVVIRPESSKNIKNANTSCIERERQALLSFRNGLVDHLNLLSSWRSEDKDCCHWIGVHCSHKTGHITALDLSPKVRKQIDNNEEDGLNLGGEIGPSLLNLTSLRYLDLSLNMFGGFPAFIGSLNELRYLNLSGSFDREVLVPQQLGNLSKLEDLDLGRHDGGRIDTLEWISRLSSLRYLEMFFVNLSSVPNSFGSIMNLPSLVSLRVGYCGISIPSFPSNFSSSKSLEVIQLISEELNSAALFRWLNVSHKLVDLTLSFSRSGLQDSILDFVGTITSLEHLDLVGNDIQGQIPMSWGNLCKLLTLDLSYNRLNGPLTFFKNWTRCTHGPFDFKKLSSLELLDISYNNFNGILPENIWKLLDLSVLSVHSNFLQGVISDSDISNLQKLKSLDLSLNSFKLNLSSNWVPPFQLNLLGLSGCKLGPAFPNWIRNQKNLVHLSISNSGISDVLPGWFRDMCDRLKYFNISHNKVRGTMMNFSSGEHIDLNGNQFDGPLPRFSSNARILILSKNKFSGNISFICSQVSERLIAFDLSSNLLSGCLPDCWMNYKAMQILDLSNNDFRGTIPGSMGVLPHLYSLRLSNNSLSGKLPSSFHSLGIISLDLGKNQLSGNIPTWIGSLTTLFVLNLESNKFWGNIPECLCQMKIIQILDLSLNNLSGTIPACLNDLTSMAQKTSEQMDTEFWILGTVTGENEDWNFFANARVTWKGMEVEFQKIIGLVKHIDLSSNKLSGEIPTQLASLYGLISLNLSSNKLIGPIPGMIGQLQQLDSLDLSNNQLSGKIPESIGAISRLSVLDLSNNNLSGRIPSSTQMLGFATAFVGNPGLCGFPLTTKCSDDGNHPLPIANHGSADDSNQEDDQWFKSPWFYGSFALGFPIGFWGVCGPSVVYAPFRQAYSQFFNRVKDIILLAIALKMAKLKRWLQS